MGPAEGTLGHRCCSCSCGLRATRITVRHSLVRENARQSITATASATQLTAAIRVQSAADTRAMQADVRGYRLPNSVPDYGSF